MNYERMFCGSGGVRSILGYDCHNVLIFIDICIYVLIQFNLVNICAALRLCIFRRIPAYLMMLYMHIYIHVLLFIMTITLLFSPERMHTPHTKISNRF
jgi:hypothetical protein